MNLFKQSLLPALVVILCSAAPVLNAAETRIDGSGFDLYYDDALPTPFLFTGSSVVFTFPPTSFASQSSSTAWDMDFDAQSMRLVADEGYVLGSVTVVQAGKLALSGPRAQVYAGGTTTATEIETGLVSNEVFVGSGTAATGSAGGSYARSWEALSTQFFSAGVRNVMLDIDGSLGARGGVSGLANIDRRFLTLSVTAVSAVPEPTSLAMLAAGVFLLGGAARRRR